MRRGKRTSLWKGLEDPWLHQDGGNIQALSYPGRFGTYSGSSYSVSIGPNKRVSKKILTNLRDHFWVDRYTRALFLEANIYNANTNLLVIVTILHEIIPTGGWSCFFNIQALKLYRYVGGMGDIVVLFDVIFMLVTLIGWYRVIKEAKRSGCKGYFSNIWYLLHFFVTVCSTLAIILFMIRLLLVKWAVQNYNDEPERFTSFAYIGQIEYIIMACMGFVTFFTTLEFMRLLRFNKVIASLLKTISILAAPIGSFFVTFMIIYMAYVSFAHCVFVDKLEGYRSVKWSIVTLLLMFMGQFDLHEFLTNAPFFGPLLFFTYMIIITMILINLFVGIICDAFAAVGEAEDDEEDKPPDLVPAIFSGVANTKSKKGFFGADPIYTEPKDDWDMMMDSFNEQADSCEYLMHTMETEEIRRTQWLQSNETNKKCWCVIAAVVGSKSVIYEEEFYDGIPELSRFLKTLSATNAQLFLRAAAKKRQLDNKAAGSNVLSMSSSSVEVPPISESETSASVCSRNWLESASSDEDSENESSRPPEAVVLAAQQFLQEAARRRQRQNEIVGNTVAEPTTNYDEGKKDSDAVVFAAQQFLKAAAKKRQLRDEAAASPTNEPGSSASPCFQTTLVEELVPHIDSETESSKPSDAVVLAAQQFLKAKAKKRQRDKDAAHIDNA